jgi:23S rRNA pseudouridine1911/1915/1917 synthase
MPSNPGYRYRVIVDPPMTGQTVLQFLACRFDHSTGTEWQARLALGEILLNGVVASGDEPLLAGQEVVWNRPPWNEPDAPCHFDLIYEDDDLIVVAKPSGLPTLPGGGFYVQTLAHLVQAQFPGAHPAHRLGRGTSGLVLFARHSEAARSIGLDWPNSTKCYRALASGVAADGQYDIRVPIGPQVHSRLGTVHAAHPGGKPSRSVATVSERRSDSTLFDIELHTGRPHQIRIHLAAIGHPLCGDPLYGPGGLPLTVDPGLPGDGGYWLHAHRLALRHPRTGERVVFRASPPEILQTTDERSQHQSQQ